MGETGKGLIVQLYRMKTSGGRSGTWVRQEKG